MSKNNSEREWDHFNTEGPATAIQKYCAIDEELKSAIREENDDDIALFSSQIEANLEYILKLDPVGTDERKLIAKFLINEFVMNDYCGFELRRKICDKLVQLIDR